MTIEKMLLTFVLFQCIGVTFGAVITKGPSDIVAESSESAQFTCETNNVSNLIWYRNGVKVTGHEYGISKDLKIYTLKIKAVSLADRGNYTCGIVEGDKITEESNVASLTVHYRIINPHKYKVYTKVAGTKNEEFDMQNFLISFPEMTNLKLYLDDKPVDNDGSKTLTFKKEDIPVGNTYTVTVKFTSLSDSDFGQYFIKYDYNGKSYETEFGNLTRLNECKSPDHYLLCSNFEKCVMKNIQTCNNKDDCGDMSDETNCPAPKDAPEDVNVRHKNFNSLEINFDEKQPYYEVLVNATDNSGIVVSQKVEKRGSLVTGLKQNTNYTITLQYITITNILGKSVSLEYHIPVRAVPKTPKLLEVKHIQYKGIYVSVENTQTDDTEYTTIFSTTDQNGNKVGKDISKEMFKTFTQAFIGDRKLQNGTTYYIKVQLENSAGKAIPLLINYTIPRMASPGPVRNLTIKVTKNLKHMNIQVHYLRPFDDGGFGKMFLEGVLKKCVVTPKKLLTRCETRNDMIGYGTQETTSFYGVDGDTEYYFEVTYRNELGQEGATVSKYFKTPSIIYPEEDTGLSTSVIIGIVIACLFVLSSMCGCLYKCCCTEAATGADDQVVYHATEKEDL